MELAVTSSLICILIGLTVALPQKHSLRDNIDGLSEMSTPCGEKGFCVPQSLCQNNRVVTTGAGIFEERIDVCEKTEICCGAEVKETQPYKSCGNNKLCVKRHLCVNDEIVTNGIGIFDERSSIDAAVETCDAFEDCCGIPKQHHNPPETPVTPATKVNATSRSSPTNCGQRNPDGVGSRANQVEVNESEFGEFPWMIAVFRDFGEKYVCGGALIAPTVVVTAAHCVKNDVANKLTVRAGEWDMKSNNEFIRDQNRPVSRIIKHEEFNRGTFVNDIALLIVDTPFEYEDNVGPICLPPANTKFDHSRCFASGWGKINQDKDSQLQNILKKVNLPIVSRDKCQKDLRNTKLGKFFELDVSFICAGGEAGVDTCSGDGGSPLVCPIEGKQDQFYHAGIVAAGIGCGIENVPAVYADVAHLRQWVDRKLTELGIEFSHFTA